ncbi:hypothetical protein PROFUN_13885 [Planoprotostelium fungivorum]|uniref:Uncharacterized protein n=1 Tax=Planoprotostelium fungivorum TaxID=1890364 RepID=A0A2P6N297_9EUKA|nr:hypothetical protein PROFUN_13885 [Planoprotostelium fungivorum]
MVTTERMQKLSRYIRFTVTKRPFDVVCLWSCLYLLLSIKGCLFQVAQDAKKRKSISEDHPRSVAALGFFDTTVFIIVDVVLDSKVDNPPRQRMIRRRPTGRQRKGKRLVKWFGTDNELSKSRRPNDEVDVVITSLVRTRSDAHITYVTPGAAAEFTRHSERCHWSLQVWRMISNLLSISNKTVKAAIEKTQRVEKLDLTFDGFGPLNFHTRREDQGVKESDIYPLTVPTTRSNNRDKYHRLLRWTIDIRSALRVVRSRVKPRTEPLEAIDRRSLVAWEDEDVSPADQAQHLDEKSCLPDRSLYDSTRDDSVKAAAIELAKAAVNQVIESVTGGLAE